MAINAGDIVWFIDAQLDKFNAGVQKASRGAKGLGQAFVKHSRVIGASMTAAGAIITGTIGKSIKHFVTMGDAVQKMAIRTGVSTEALSELGFAAEQSGASLESIGKAFKNQADFVEDAKDGLSTATDAMAKLGITIDQLQGQTPEQVFMTLSNAIAGIEDPMTRAALANDVFKRSGQELLPFFAEGAEGIAALRAEAVSLGISMSQDQANAAAQFSDSMNSLKKSLGAVGLQIGNILVPILNDMVPKITAIVTKFIAWIKENPKLTKTIVLIAGAVGAALLVLGPLLILLPGLIAAFSALPAIMGVVAAAFVFLTGPVGWLVAAIVAAVALIIANWDFLKKRTMDIFNATKDFIGRVLDRIMDKIGGFIKRVKEAIDFAIKLAKAVGKATGIPGFASGGIVGHASGGVVGGHNMVMVGERGPELAALPNGTRIMSNTTMRSLGANPDRIAGGGGGGGAITLNVSIDGSLTGSEIVDKIKSPLLQMMAGEMRQAMR